MRNVVMGVCMWACMWYEGFRKFQFINRFSSVTFKNILSVNFLLEVGKITASLCYLFTNHFLVTTVCL